MLLVWIHGVFSLVALAGIGKGHLKNAMDVVSPSKVKRLVEINC